MIQAFVDDSGGTDHQHIVLAGQIAPAAMWKDFVEEWDAVLRESPGVQSFKMDDAVGRNKSWHRLTRDERDDKLFRLARVISRHGFTAIHCTAENFFFNSAVDTLERSLGRPVPKLFRDPYLYAFQIITLGICSDLLERGQKYRFELYLDNHRLQRKIQAFYPVVSALAPADIQAILPVQPQFRSDDAECPLQAADMLAWFFRNKAHGAYPSTTEFDWLLPRLFTFPVSQYSVSFKGTEWRPRFEQIYGQSVIDKIVSSYDDWADSFGIS